MKYSHIVWDFNGTVLDDIDVAIEAENVMLRRRGMREITSREEYYRVFCFPVRDYYVKLGYDFERESYDAVADEWIAEFTKAAKRAGLRRGVADLIKYFSGIGVEQCLLSASESAMLERQIEQLGIRESFSEILGVDNYYGNGKIGVARNWIERKCGGNFRGLFIGDTCHDFDVASAVGADCVLVEGGHASREILEKCGVPVFRDIPDLHRALIAGEFEV